MTSRKSIKEESEIHQSELSDSFKGLKLLKNIAITSRGPHGKVKVIQNSAGGHVNLTSSSGRLLPALSISRPLLKLLTTSAEGQIQTFGDGGLFLMACCLNIVELSENSLTGNRILIEIFEELMELALGELKSDNFLGKIHLSLSNTVQILSLVKTILSSKPLCKLSEDSVNLLASMIVECFLSSVKDDNKNTNSVLILTAEGKSVNQSRHVPGILMLYPEISSSCEKKLHLITKDKKIVVALVTTSMSGDSEEVMQGRYQQNIEVDAEQTVIECMKSFCHCIKDCGVGIVMCQKVVHPIIKFQLRQSGIFVVERMGAKLTSFVQDLTGATPIESFSCKPEKYLGSLDTVNHVILHKKSYLHLQRASSGMNTLVLCNLEEEMVSELKMVCETALNTLQDILQYPILFCGGGCWETCLSFRIQQKLKENQSCILEKTKWTASALSTASEIFIKSLLQVAKTTGYSGAMMMTSFPTFHSWRVPLNSDEFDHDHILTCNCGMVNEPAEKLMPVNEVNLKILKVDTVWKEEVCKLQQISQTKSCVVDSYISNVSAFRKAVFTAIMMLNVGNCLQDIN